MFHAIVQRIPAALAFAGLALMGPPAIAAAAPAPLLHELFTDHAVLQRDQPIEVFGQAQPREVVVVTFDDRRTEGRADASGRWRVTLPPQPAGGPHKLNATAASGRTETRSDLLTGDVYLCSGQSNMEFALSGALNATREISNATDDSIRLLAIAHATAPAPLEHFSDEIQWRVASPQSVRDFSAACYFFARELARNEHVPFGLIQSTWGGSRIEPWISAQGLAGVDGYADRLALLADYARNPAKGPRIMGAFWQRWYQTHAGSPAAPWRETPGEGWRDVPQPMRDWKTWGVPELAQHDGMVWFRRRFSLDAQQAASPARLSIGGIDEVDQTWLNGVPVGNTFGYGTERTYEIPVGTLHAGENLLVVNVLSTWDAGGMYGPPEHLLLAPTQQAAVSLAGGWQYHTVAEGLGFPPRAPWESVSGLTAIYNAMISPLTPLHLRGVLWYQGESNTSEAAAYRELLKTLFSDWRAHFRAPLPFLVVQLPNFGTPSFAPTESAWAALREAQRRAVQDDGHAALAVTIDAGEPQELHPPNKQTVGTRLARAARRLVYGEPITASGPVVRSAQHHGGEITLDFDDADGGLRTFGSSRAIGFEVCADGAGSCRYADSQVGHHQVVLDAGAGPVTRVRYCWADAPLCNLYDASGLPAAPFEVEVH